VGILAALIVGAVLLWAARQLSPRTRRRLIVAGAVFLAGALGAESLVGALYRNLGLEGGHPAYMALTVIEESLEAAGVVIALWAVVSRLRLVVGGSLQLTPDPAEARALRRA